MILDFVTVALVVLVGLVFVISITVSWLFDRRQVRQGESIIPPLLSVVKSRCNSCIYLRKHMSTTTRPEGAVGDGPWSPCNLTQRWMDHDDGCNKHEEQKSS